MRDLYQTINVGRSRCSLQVIADVLENRSNLRAKQDERGDHDDGYKCDNQSVLDESLTFFACKNTIEHCESSPTRRMDTITAPRDHLKLLHPDRMASIAETANQH